MQWYSIIKAFTPLLRIFLRKLFGSSFNALLSDQLLGHSNRGVNVVVDSIYFKYVFQTMRLLNRSLI